MNDERIGRWFLTVYGKLPVRIESISKTRGLVTIFFPLSSITTDVEPDRINWESPQEMSPDQVQHWRLVQEGKTDE